MAKIEQKKPIVDEISEKINGASSVVLINPIGLTVAQDTELRKALRAEGVQYKVYKNTMMKIAFKGTDCEQLDAYLDGPSAVAISKDDATAAARVVYKFAKDNDKFQIKGGIVEGKAYDEKALAEIAKIPSREELLSRFLGSIQSPITNFARVIKQIAEKKAEGTEAAAPAEEAAPAAEAAPEA